MTAPTRRALLVNAATVALVWPLLDGCSVRVLSSEEFYNMLADIVIPRTHTPGASDVGVGAFMARAFTQGLFSATGDIDLQLRQALSERGGERGFINNSAERQKSIVAALDRETFASASKVAPAPTQAGHLAQPAADPAIPPAYRAWRTAKTAIMVGYYYSQPGASRELAYDFVPGRFDPSIPYRRGERYLSNNWQANVG